MIGLQNFICKNQWFGLPTDFSPFFDGNCKMVAITVGEGNLRGLNPRLALLIDNMSPLMS